MMLIIRLRFLHRRAGFALDSATLRRSRETLQDHPRNRSCSWWQESVQPNPPNINKRIIEQHSTYRIIVRAKNPTSLMRKPLCLMDTSVPWTAPKNPALGHPAQLVPRYPICRVRPNKRVDALRSGLTNLLANNAHQGHSPKSALEMVSKINLQALMVGEERPFPPSPDDPRLQPF